MAARRRRIARLDPESRSSARSVDTGTAVRAEPADGEGAVGDRLGLAAILTAAPGTPPPPALVPGVQRLAGNRAAARLVQRDRTGPASGGGSGGGAAPGSEATAATTAVPRSSVSSVSSAAETIYSNLHIGGLSDPEREQVLRELLVHANDAADLRAAYQRTYRLDLLTDVATMGRADGLRASEYLTHGRLRGVAKVMLAIDGAGTAHEALWRVLVEAFNEGDPFGKWQTLVAQPLEICRRWSGFPNLDQALADDLSGAALDKARALARYGLLRPVDKIRVGIGGMDGGSTLILDGVREGVTAHGGGDGLKRAYRTAYESDLEGALFGAAIPAADMDYDTVGPAGSIHGPTRTTGALSGRDASEAQAMLGGRPDDPDRLVSITRAATSGFLSHADFVFDEVRRTTEIRDRSGNPQAAQAARTQLERLVSQLATGADALGVNNVFGGFSAGELRRLRALLGVQETVGVGYLEPAVLNDPVVRSLVRLGGVDSDSVFTALMKADAAELNAFAAAYGQRDSNFRRYVTSFTTVNSGEAGAIPTILNGSVWTRLRVAAGGVFTDHPDYAVRAITLASDSDRIAMRAAIRQNRRDGTWPSDSAGRTLARLWEAFNDEKRRRVTDALSMTQLSALQEAEDLEQSVAHERSDWFGTTSDLDDERRELSASIASASSDGRLSAVEERQIRQATARTASALDGYRRVRDEATSYASQLVGLASGLLVTALTGGAAGPAVVAALLRSAAASAVARLATEKMLRGDRFEVTSDEGARMFMLGAVDGVMNVMSAGMAAGVLNRVGAQSVVQAVERQSASYGARMVHSMLEGGMSGGVGSTVDAISNQETWRGGFGQGLITTIESAATGTTQGAAMSGGMTSVGAAAGSIRQRLGGTATPDGAHPEGTGPHPDGAHPEGNGPHPVGTPGTGEGGGGGGTFAHAGPGPALGGALSDGHPLVVAARSAHLDQACDGLLDHLGRWETAIAHLRQGTGGAAGLSEPVRRELGQALVARRNRLRTILRERFAADTQGAASSEPGSDVDLSVTGENAGQRLIEARTYLDLNHPGWQQRFRMALMVDANRISTFEAHLGGLGSAEAAATQARMTRNGELLLLARQARHASPEARAELLGRVTDPMERARVEQLASMDGSARAQAHDQALLDGDRLARELATTTDPAARARLAAQVSEAQMLANSLGDDAFVTSGGVRGFAQGQAITSPHARYQAVIDQVDMMVHQIHEHGGVVQALRRYEIFKYLQRVCQTLEAAGIDDPRVRLLRNQSELVYRVDRGATAALEPRVLRPEDLAGSASQAGVRYSDLGPVGVYSDSFLLTIYGLAREVVDTHAPTLRAAAMGEAPGAGTGTPAGRAVITLPEPGPAPAPHPAADSAGPGTAATAAAALPATGAGGEGGMPLGAAPAGAGPTPAPHPAPIGLAAPDAMVRVVDGVDRALQAVAPSQPAHAHAEAAFSVVAAELQRQGIPPPRFIAAPLAEPGLWGSYDPTRHTITLNTAARTAGASGPLAFAPGDPAAAARMVELLMHEARHAEQTYQMIRYRLAGAADRAATLSGVDPALALAAAEADALRGIHAADSLVRAARANPLPPGDSPARQLGQAAWTDMAGPGRASGDWAQRVVSNRHAIENHLGRTDQARRQAEARLAGISWIEFWRRTERAELQRQILELQTAFTDVHRDLVLAQRIYYGLFYEIDAFATGGGAARLFSERVAARTAYDRALTRLHDARTIYEFVVRSAPAEQMRAVSHLNVAEREFADALARLIPLIPDDPHDLPAPATPAATGPSGRGS